MTGSPPASTCTAVILPPAALTVIPRFGALSVLPSVGVIDKRTSLVGLVATAGTPAWPAPWLVAGVELPQAEASKPSMPQTSAVPNAWRRSRDD